MDIIVKPNNWILPNRIGYNNEIYKTFNPSKYSSKQDDAVLKKPCKNQMTLAIYMITI